jgi:dTDP-4-amino-4,6-dideoxygalactose transaminase
MAVARQRIHLPPKAWRRAIAAGFRDDRGDATAISRFERAFAEFIGVPDAVVVPSGRAGLRFTLDALELEHGAEVVCSAFAYPVVPYIAHLLGYKVRFADCELDTLGMDPDSLAEVISDRTRVVITTHLYGVPCRIREIRELATSHGAILIEDCAHCYGASVGGQLAGSFGTYGYFSFETSKPINTMGGGIVTVSDTELGERVRRVARAQDPKPGSWLRKRLLTTTFEALVTNPLLFNLGVYPALRILQSREDSDRFASGYHPDDVTLEGRMGRFTTYQATLGLDQMRSVTPMLDRRIANAERLIRHLSGLVRFQLSSDPDVRSNYMLVTALMPRMQEVSKRLLELGVDTKHHYMRDCTAIGDGGGSFPRAARAEQHVLHLPAYPELEESRIDWIADRIRRAINELGALPPSE